MGDRARPQNTHILVPEEASGSQTAAPGTPPSPEADKAAAHWTRQKQHWKLVYFYPGRCHPSLLKN